MIKGVIGNEIRRLRFNANEMTQQDLADQVGVTRQTIAALEKNKYSPSLDLAFRISRVFGVGVEDVFQFTLTRTKK
jgi:putative transcriptional regulator